MKMLALVAGFFLVTRPAYAQVPDPFPHQKHARMFPLCESCHRGIAAGDTRTEMPAESTCRECHNGTDAAVVSWRRTPRAEGLLRFSHPAHARQVDSAGKSCVACHGSASTADMRVRPAAAATCLSCHTHRASDHLAEDNRCGVCHVPLTGARGLPMQRIASLPKPASHERRDFVVSHAPAASPADASCAICHARQSCARCHVNAATDARITSLLPDERVANVVRGLPPRYPVPADHQRDDFATAHGDAAKENLARCSTCHARPSCTACHIGSKSNAQIARMPVARLGEAPGVQLRLQQGQRRVPPLALRALDDTTVRPVRVHDVTFRTNHKAAAGMAAPTCAGCHEQRFCSDCHAGEGTRRFHAANFAQRHAADAYSRDTRCASCHNTELFCRSCHRTSGLTSRGRLDAAFHDAQPQWLLQHGRAARQGLQSCATCHAQRDCLTCHSTLGWGVNPHGPGFNGSRAAKQNATQCLLCHLQVPGRR